MSGHSGLAFGECSDVVSILELSSGKQETRYNYISRSFYYSIYDRSQRKHFSSYSRDLSGRNVITPHAGMHGIV